jgi:hypothetical protein
MTEGIGIPSERVAEKVLMAATEQLNLRVGEDVEVRG